MGTSLKDLINHDEATTISYYVEWTTYRFPTPWSPMKTDAAVTALLWRSCSEEESQRSERTTPTRSQNPFTP